MITICRERHNATVVYPNRHGQTCPICVALVRYTYVNTLKIQQKHFRKIDQNWRELRNPLFQNSPTPDRGIDIQAVYPIFLLFITTLLVLGISFSLSAQLASALKVSKVCIEYFQNTQLCLKLNVVWSYHIGLIFVTVLIYFFCFDF